MSVMGKGKIEQGDVVESTAGKSREERLQMYMDTFTDEYKFTWDSNDEEVDRRGCRPMKFRDFANHQLDKIESDGFDMQDYSKFNDFGILVWLYHPPEDLASEDIVAELKDCSCYAIDEYNRKNGTRYGNVHVLKANSQALSPCRYYITFQATDERNNSETFQARVNICFPEPKKDGGMREGGIEFVKDVELVRIRTAPRPIVITRSRKASYREGQCSKPASNCAAQLAT